jgi:hypothetical protein
MAFSAATDGHVTLVQTTTVATGETILAANRNSIYTASSYQTLPKYIHRYAIQANGSLTGPEASINPRDYGGGANAWFVGPAVMDRSGQYLTVWLWHGYQPEYNVWQTYKVGADGALEFQGYDTINDSTGYGPQGGAISALSGNDQFGYGVLSYAYGATQFVATKRNSNGTLIRLPDFTETGPVPNPEAGTPFEPYGFAADSSNHLAVLVGLPFSGSLASSFWLASYTIDSSTGAIESNNSYMNMPLVPIPDYDVDTLAVSPAGDFAAVGGYKGLQLFHFNGADPPTLDGGLLLADQVVNQVAWDNDHHLYVLANTIVPPNARSQYSLYVYTVTDAGITQAPGSPWNVPNGYGLMLVPRSMAM